MRIVSKFRDYYDYVEFLYSKEGGDESNRYERDKCFVDQPLTESTYPTNNSLIVEVQNHGFPLPRFNSLTSYNGSNLLSWKQFPWRFRWLSVCGCLYLLVKEVPLGHPFEHISDPTHSFHVIPRDHPSWDYIRPGFSWNLPLLNKNRLSYEEVVNREVKTLVDVSKRIQKPVFVIRESGSSRLLIEVETPCLRELGIQKIVKAEQMYQRISMFMNTLKDNPDSSPPIQVEEGQRFSQKGFDSKLSFRGTHGRR